MNLLLSPQGDILGHTPTPDNALRHQLMLRTPVEIVTRRSDLETLPPKTREGLFDAFGVRSDAMLWKRIKARKGLPKWGKVSVKDVMRCIYTRNPNLSLTEDELIEAIPGASWTSIVTAISMLKNPKYAEGETMNIVHKNGKYRRQDG
jgi:hypothetical protein